MCINIDMSSHLSHTQSLADATGLDIANVCFLYQLILIAPYLELITLVMLCYMVT